LTQALARMIPAYRRLLDELQQARDAHASARRTSSASKSRAVALEQKVDRLRSRIARLQAQHRAAKAAHASRTLSPTVLEQSIAVRLAALTQPSRRELACARDEDFASRSAAYSELRAATDYRTQLCAGPVDVRGLHWWVPRQERTDPNSLEANVAAGWLPLRAILSTRELAQGTIMLDIGANIGTTSIPRVVLGDFQYVYAAEPEPVNYACLVQNVVGNGLGGFVLPDRVAIGAEEGVVTMELAPTIGAHRVVPSAAGSDDATLPGRVTVQSRTLDKWVESLGVDPALVAFVKCDVQGWEPHVLEGARRTLRQRHIAWALEVSPKHLSHAGSSLPDFCRLVRAHFSRFIDLHGHRRRDRPTSDLEATLDFQATRRRYTDILVYNT
jgi:FkbM family methyltransferase